MQEVKKFFDRHTGSCFQGICRTVSFQTPVIAAITFRTIWINADVFNQTTTHMIALVNFMSGDDRTAKVRIQKKNQGTVKLWMIPEFQICSGF